MSIQVTPIPRLTVLTVPAFTLGTANAAGSELTSVASDSEILVFDGTLPDAITFGQSGAAGSSTTAARRSHAHAMASETATPAATQAEMEAATSNTVFVTPGRTKNSPGVTKAYCVSSAAGHLNTGSYNLASITDEGTGDRTFVWDVDFANTQYVVLGTLQDDAGFNRGSTRATGSNRWAVFDTDGTTLADKTLGISALGIQ